MDGESWGGLIVLVLAIAGIHQCNADEGTGAFDVAKDFVMGTDGYAAHQMEVTSKAGKRNGAGFIQFSVKNGGDRTLEYVKVRLEWGDGRTHEMPIVDTDRAGGSLFKPGASQTWTYWTGDSSWPTDVKVRVIETRRADA